VSATLLLFWSFAGIAILSGLLCITRRNPVASALWLVVTLFQIAALFVMLNAQFLGVLQVLVYAGAIMVLFVFVIMLLNLGHLEVSDMKGPAGIVVATLLAGGVGLQLITLMRATPPRDVALPSGVLDAAVRTQGLVGVVARPLFTDYLVPFEITSVLLLAAIVGAVVLAKRHI
jgi:NADH-quinone oxidoreductase subunit J